MKKEEEIFDRTYWEKTGFLEHAPEDRRDAIVKAFTTSIKHVTIESKTDDYERFLLLPMIYRIVVIVDISDDEIKNIVDRFLIEIKESNIRNYKNNDYFNINYEAEFIANFSEKEINQLNT